MNRILRVSLAQCVCLILILLTINVYSQKISFNRLGVNDGLSQVCVNAIAQDELGRIWIGTRDGLNVYDGTEINTFRPIRGDSTSLLDYSITDLKVDGTHLWVVTKSGVSCLNTKSLLFTNFLKNNVACILNYKNEILVGTHNGLFILDVKNKSFIPATHIFEESLKINRLYTDRSNTLWIGTEKGLFNYNPARNEVSELLKENSTAIFTDNKKQLWIGTLNNGVFLFNNKQKLIKHFKQKKNINSIVNNQIRDINEDSKGNIWVGTFLGLSIINSTSHNISNYIHEESNNQSLSHNSIYTIVRDKQDNMWVGTYFGGISYSNKDTEIYKVYPIVESNSPNGLNFSVINTILEDYENNILIATEGGGLNYYDRKNNSYSQFYKKSDGTGLNGNNVKALHFINEEEVLIGTYDGGLNILNLKNNKIKSFPLSSYNTIEDIISYKDFFLLVTNGEVIKFNPTNNRFTPFFTKKEHLNILSTTTRVLFEDSYGKLWIGTEKNGLLSFDSTTNTIKRYLLSQTDPNSISANNISCIYEDHKFRLWIGTLGGGLNLLDKKSDSFINYTMKNMGLSSNFIQGIMESRYGNLWISCSKGLSRFDVENLKVYNYTQKNGLPLKELNHNALLLTTDGELFVGGVDGLVSFKEEKILEKPNNFNLFLSSIIVKNKKVVPLDKSNVLSIDLPFTKEISLGPDQNVFTINYTSDNYLNANQSTYLYKLKNFDDNWIDAGYKTSATYTSLSPGKYVFQVQCLGGVEETLVDEEQLIINIFPPVYKSFYAIVSYILIAFGILYWLKLNFQNRMRLTNQIKMEQNEKERIKSLNQLKLNFFTNLSHEFRTPLTLIIGTLESILESGKTQTEQNRKLQTTYNNANRLNNLITELLDFRKLESGKLHLKVNENQVNEFAEKIFLSFVEYARYQKIDYKFIALETNQSLWFDRNQIEKVLYNIINNSFKYVDKNTGSIELKIINNAYSIDFLITDNGIGIPKNKIPQLFDLYYQVDNIDSKQNKHSNGIGLAISKSIIKEHKGEILVESKEGKGTTFIVQLKRGKTHFNKNEIVSKTSFVTEKHDLTNTPFDLQINDLENSIEPNEKAPIILIVEDNTELLNLLVDILNPIYNIKTANNGNEGFEAALQLQPDLIISDIMMPKLTGTEMCEKLKRNIQTSHIPVILLTARATTKFKIEGLETGADDYITKPFNVQLLKAKVKNIIYNRLLIQQKFKLNPELEIKEITNNSRDTIFLEKANTILNKNLDNSDFDVQDFANDMGVGRTKLYSKIKGITGQTVNDYILSTRLKNAAKLILSNDELNISEIAYSVGFSTPRYFSKCFRDHFGISPSKYGKANVEVDSTTENLNKDD